MARIFIIRHGETTDNKEQIFSGKRDVDLTEKGTREAKEIGEELKDEKITKAYQSSQLRSKHTLDLVLDGYHSDIQIFTDDRIRERDYGDLTGKSKIETEQQNPKMYKLWHRSYDVPPPNGESIKDVETRVMSFLYDLLPKLSPSDVVLISAHGNSIRPMRKYFEHLTNEEMSRFEHEPGKIYTYTV
ncbi:MAG: 2,3-bisphosphoglycerate-dependent phosphoglycerate mutase [Candidatus Levybacteria bacterium]|nr:2,3-bisphosphoglycerate-dependent phosphoglycerate mutase [Candidatus Levybacteria bacterium]